MAACSPKMTRYGHQYAITDNNRVFAFRVGRLTECDGKEFNFATGEWEDLPLYPILVPR